jgi:uncharacterized protein
MLRKILLIIFLVLIVYLIFIIFYRPKTKTTSIVLNNTKYNFEIAQTIAQKTIGLSNRNTLCKNCGMIFVYPKENIYPFWMKDTLIPLDMIWLDKNGKIVDYKKAFPEPNTPINKLTLYKNTSPAQYVIELNLGDFDKLKLKIGDTIDISNIHEQ